MEIKGSVTAFTFPDSVKWKRQDTQLCRDMIPNEKETKKGGGKAERDRDRQR